MLAAVLISIQRWLKAASTRLRKTAFAVEMPPLQRAIPSLAVVPGLGRPGRGCI